MSSVLFYKNMTKKQTLKELKQITNTSRSVFKKMLRDDPPAFWNLCRKHLGPDDSSSSSSSDEDDDYDQTKLDKEMKYLSETFIKHHFAYEQVKDIHKDFEKAKEKLRDFAKNHNITSIDVDCDDFKGNIRIRVSQMKRVSVADMPERVKAKYSKTIDICRINQNYIRK